MVSCLRYSKLSSWRLQSKHLSRPADNREGTNVRDGEMVVVERGSSTYMEKKGGRKKERKLGAVDEAGQTVPIGPRRDLKNKGKQKTGGGGGEKRRGG